MKYAFTHEVAGPFPKFDGVDLPGTSSTSPAAPQPPRARSTVPPLSPEDRAKYLNTWMSVNPSSDLLDGERARNVLQKAKLPIEQLGQIWALADTRQRGALDVTEFIVSMHLIQSIMNGSLKTIPAQLPPGIFEAAARGPSARSQRQQDSISSIQSQDPSQQQFSGQQANLPMRSQLTGPPGRGSPSLNQAPQMSPVRNSQATQMQPQLSGQVGVPEWDVKPHEKANYDHLFDDIDKSGKGYITGEEAVGFFLQSKLPEEQLALVWDLADMDLSGRLSKDFFAVAMHLIKAKLGGKDLPKELPLSLIPPSARSAAPSQAQGIAQNRQPTAGQSQIPANAPFGAPQGQNPSQGRPQSPAQPSSAAADLFGLNDSFSAPPQPTASPPARAFTDNYASIDRVASPVSPDSAGARVNPPAPRGFGGQPAFVPSSSFGQSIQQPQQQQQSRGVTQAAPAPQMPQPQQLSQQAPRQGQAGPEQDLLSDADPYQALKLNNDSTEIANLNNQMSSLQTQHQQLNRDRGQTSSEMEGLRAQKESLTSRLTQVRQAYDEEVKTVRAMQLEQTNLRNETRELNKEVSLLEASLGAVRQQHEQINGQLEQDRSDNLAIKQRIKSANDQTVTLKATLEQVQKDAKQQRGLVSINTKQLNTLEAEHERLNAEIEAEHARLAEERTKAEQQQRRIAEMEQERARMNEEQRRSAMISPAPSVTTPSTNPFHRVGSPAGASSSQQTRSLMSPFANNEESDSGTSFPFMQTAAAAAGAAIAGIGAGAAAIGLTESKETKGDSMAGSETDGKSSTYDTAPNTATSERASQSLSGFNNAFSSDTGELNEKAQDRSEGEAGKAVDVVDKEPTEAKSPSAASNHGEQLPVIQTSAPSREIVSPQPVNPQAQSWSDADPFTADPRVASPRFEQARPRPAAVSALALPSNASDDGSISTSVQAHAPASLRETQLDSRPMTPASMTWESEANVSHDHVESRESQSRDFDDDGVPTGPEVVQKVLTHPPQEDNLALQSPSEVRAMSPAVPGAFPTESNSEAHASIVPTTAESAIFQTQPPYTETTPDNALNTTNEQTYSEQSAYTPGVTQAAEVDSSDDETIEEPRGSTMFSDDQRGSVQQTEEAETASTHTITREEHVAPMSSVVTPSAQQELNRASTPTNEPVSNNTAQPSTNDDDFDEFDDLEEATEADEDDELNQSYTTQTYESTFDAPSARSSYAPAPVNTNILSTPTQLNPPYREDVQASPARDFSEFSHYSSVIGDPSGLAPAIQDTDGSTNANYGQSASNSYSATTNAARQGSASNQTGSSGFAGAPAPPTSRHGASLAPKRPEPARAISAADDPMLIELMDMGFDRQKSVAALEKYNYDLGAATDALLKGK